MGPSSRALLLLLATARPGSLGAQTLADSLKISLGGEIRVRHEVDARTSGVGTDQATLLRSRLSARVHAREGVGAFFQISDSRAFGEEQSTLTDASADRIDVHQAYLSWAPTDRIELRLGRQEIAFADERLVGAVNWANVSRAFDGLRASAKAGPWTIDGFGAVLREGDALLGTGLDPRTNQDRNQDRTLYGVWASSKRADLFALAERNATDGQGGSDIDRFTLGGYGRLDTGRFVGRTTLAVQLGRRSSADSSRQDIRAYIVSAALAYRLPTTVAGELGAQIDLLSGDRSTGDGNFGAFNTLYATNHAFYGYMDLWLDIPKQTGGLGLVDLIGRGSAQPGEWTLRVDLHHFRLARSPQAGSRSIGTELDLTLTRPLAPGLDLRAGYSLFAPSAAAGPPPISLGGDVLHWAYLQTRMHF
ncbi:MAG: alginate export family protein [Gemmatimonadota bacterium]